MKMHKAANCPEIDCSDWGLFVDLEFDTGEVRKAAIVTPRTLADAIADTFEGEVSAHLNCTFGDDCTDEVGIEVSLPLSSPLGDDYLVEASLDAMIDEFIDVQNVLRDEEPNVINAKIDHLVAALEGAVQKLKKAKR